MSVAFHTSLDLRDNGNRTFTLLAPLVYDSDVLHSSVVVPVQFVTDLASIPRGLWNILPPIGGYDEAAVIHDYLYKTGKVLNRSIERGDADKTLLEAMEICGVGRFQRWTIYAGVRAGGWLTWNRYRKADAGSKNSAAA